MTTAATTQGFNAPWPIALEAVAGIPDMHDLPHARSAPRRKCEPFGRDADATKSHHERLQTLHSYIVYLTER